MKEISILITSFLIVATTAPLQAQKMGAEISWDSWGVPHIQADNVEALFYAQGWAQMQNHANLILDLYGSARGRGAEYWGIEKLQNDLLIHTMGFSALADEWEKGQDAELKAILQSFVTGMNDFALSHPDQIEEKNKVVLPLTAKDVNMHGMYIVFTLFIGGNDLGRVQQWPDMGSNTYAIAPQRSASGHAMLVQNPHLPWWREFLFFESHLMLQDKNMYGATLVGFPGIAIGFNNHLGWSHTDNTIDNADTYELTLKDDGYLIDNEVHHFEQTQQHLKVRLEGGEFMDTMITVLKTMHGPVVNRTDDKILALRMVGMDRPNMMLQWWRMINSHSFEEFENALKMAQIPFWNVMYADKTGTIFYLFNGLVPKRSEGDWDYWNRIIPEGKSTDIWTEVHSYEDLPKVKNPTTGWLQNSNDPPWTSTIPTVLDPDDYPDYMAPKYMAYRPQRSAHMLMQDESITYEELMAYKLSTRLEFADRILDDLFKAIEVSDSEKARQAMKVLKEWDRSADVDSKGMLLFYMWSRKFNLWQNQNYTTVWKMEDPLSGPDGIADPARAVELLENTVDELQQKFGKLDMEWGDYYRIDYNGKNLPGNGVDGSVGVVRVAWPGRMDEDHMYIGGGDSWVGVIEFGDNVQARVLLSYGNSSEKNSPNNGDQLELFSKKELRVPSFTVEEVKKNTVKVDKL